MNAASLGWVPVLVAITVAGLAGSCSEKRPVRFPHRAHLVGIECGTPGKPDCLSCAECHTPSAHDRVGKLPGEALCSRCHDDGAAVRGVLSAKPERLAGAIRFDHDEHLAMPALSGQCVPCHKGVLTSTEPNLPPMSQCFSCHEHEEQWQKGECRPCHASADLSKVLPRTFLRHEGDFMRHHGALSIQNERVCSACHSDADCDDCHDVTQVLGIERRRPERIHRQFVHRGDFVVRHAIEAQSQPARCQRCHEPETCDACHVLRGVSGNVMGGRNPHPPGWVGTDTGALTFHGRAARRDILACASCHDQGPATNCIRCHKVGAYGGNPHPNGWRSARSIDEEMCRYCHE